MNWTINLGSKADAVSDEEIQTALKVLTALKAELKAHTKRRMERIPDNVAWNEKDTHIGLIFEATFAASIVCNWN